MENEYRLSRVKSDIGAMDGLAAHVKIAVKMG